MKLVPRLRLFLSHSPARSRRVAWGGARGRWAQLAIGSGLVLVLLVQIGLAVAVDTVKPEWRDPEYGHRLHQVKQWQRLRPERPLVLAIGSSRTLMGLSPMAMGFPDEPNSPLVYNFGQSAAGPLQLLLTFLRLLDEGVRPTYLLVELFPAAIAMSDGPAEEQLRWYWSPRLGAGDLRRLAPYSRDQQVLRRQWVEERLNPAYNLRLALMSHNLPRWLPLESRRDYLWQFDQYGWQAYPFDQVDDARRRKGTELARGGYRAVLSSSSYHVSGMADRSLRDIVARARQEGIAVAFYLTPEGPEFRSWYGPEARANFNAYRELLMRELGVSVFNATDGFGEDEFADSHHMLRGGASRFSRRLADECLRPWLGR